MSETVTVDDLEIAFREALPDDAGIVFNAWLKGHRQNGDWPPRVSASRYFDEHKTTVARLIAQSRCLVACNAARPTQVLGFVVFERARLHWVFVKQPFRGWGIARHLLGRTSLQGASPIACTHWSRAASRLRAKGYPWFYDPFLLEETHGQVDRSAANRGVAGDVAAVRVARGSAIEDHQD